MTVSSVSAGLSRFVFTKYDILQTSDLMQYVKQCSVSHTLLPANEQTKPADVS